MPLIRSISGLRGTVGDSLTPEIVCRYAAAFARYCGAGTIVVGGDGRPSGAWIEQLVAGTLRACGLDVRMLGMVPTPTVQMMTEKSDAVGGISVTASHNPSQWNGLKFLNAGGIFLDADECAKFFPIVDRGGTEFAAWDGMGSFTIADSDAINAHVIAAVALPFVDADALRRRNFKVVVDAVNASGSVIVPMLLEALGCTVVKLFCRGDGLFPHTPEPLPENLTQLREAVPAHHADLGIAVDPDADRLVLIDERGAAFGEEYTITQAAEFMLGWCGRQYPGVRQSVAVNLSTTRAVDDVAARYGTEVIRTPVGEINVVRAMKRRGSVIGGEGSGGVILPMLHYGRDSLAGIAITLSHLLLHDSLSAMKALLPEYAIVKHKAELRDGMDVMDVIERVKRRYSADAKVNTEDGIRLDFERSWVHLRGSNTEPIVRVIAEAPTSGEADALAEKFIKEIS